MGSEYRNLQGTWPVISLSFARVQETNFTNTREKICEILRNLYIKYSFLRESDTLTKADRDFFDRILAVEIRSTDATSALYQLSSFLYRYYERKVIIIMDEYDTPIRDIYNPWSILNYLEKKSLQHTGQIPARTAWWIN